MKSKTAKKKEEKLLAFFQSMMPEIEKERKQPYTESELKEVQRLMKDFGIDKKQYENVPDHIKTVGQLHRWKYILISELLEKYA